MSIAFFAGGFQVFSVGSYGVTTLDLLIILYTVLFVLKAVIYNEELRIPRSLITLGISIFVASVILSSLIIFFDLISTHIIQYFKSFLHFMQLLIIAVIFLTKENDMELADNFVKIWLVLSLVLNIFGIYQLFARALDLPLAWLDFSNISMTYRGAVEDDAISQLSLRFGNFYRATSVFSEPTALATYNLYVLSYMLIPVLQKQKRFFQSRLLNFSIILFAVLAMFLSFSLTGILGLILIFVGIFIMESTRARLSIAKYIMMITLLVIPVDLVVESYTDTSVIGLFTKRISGTIFKDNKMYERTDGDSFNSRSNAFFESYYIWTTSPIVGVGLGLTQYQEDITIVYSDYSIMAALSEMGIIGAVGFTMFFVGLFYISYKANKLAKSDADITEMERRHFGILIYIMIIQFEINFITGNSISSPNLWFVLIPSLIVMYRYMKISNYEFISFRVFNNSLKELYFLNKGANLNENI